MQGSAIVGLCQQVTPQRGPAWAAPHNYEFCLPIYTGFSKGLHMEHRLLGYALLGGKGIEIGALHQPAQVPPHCQVAYCDAHSAQDIVRHFPELAALPLTHVDHIIDLDRSGLQAFADGQHDFVILNHVIEHVANPLAVLGECLRVLRPGGLLVLAAPDKDYTFDKPRVSTPFAHLQAEHQAGVNEVSDEHYAEFLRAVHPEVLEHGPDTWNAALHSVRLRREHAHVWNSAEFRDFIDQALPYLGWQAHPVFEWAGVDTQGEYFSVWRRTSGAEQGQCIDWQQQDGALHGGLRHLAGLQRARQLMHWQASQETAAALTATQAALQASQSMLERTVEQANAQQQVLQSAHEATKVHARNLQARAEIAEAAHQTCAEQLAQEQATLRAVYASRSWRWTAPLRSSPH